MKEIKDWWPCWLSLNLSTAANLAGILITSQSAGLSAAWFLVSTLMQRLVFHIKQHNSPWSNWHYKNFGVSSSDFYMYLERFLNNFNLWSSHKGDKLATTTFFYCPKIKPSYTIPFLYFEALNIEQIESMKNGGHNQPALGKQGSLPWTPFGI